MRRLRWFLILPTCTFNYFLIIQQLYECTSSQQIPTNCSGATSTSRQQLLNVDEKWVNLYFFVSKAKLNNMSKFFGKNIYPTNTTH